MDAATEVLAKPDDRRADRGLAWFAVCAAAGFGPLMVKMNFVLVLLQGYRRPVLFADDVLQYLPLAAPLVLLLLWHWQPARSWPWLMLAGALFSLPVLLDALDVPLELTGGAADAETVLLQCAPVASLIGVLGAATWLHKRGRRAVGAALLGTALVCQLVGAAVLLTVGHDAITFSRGVTITLFVLGIAGAVGAVLLSTFGPARPIDRPTPRATLVGGIGGGATVLLLAWQPDPLADRGGDYFLHVGLVLLAIGIVLGALGGPRVLLGAAAAGLLIGPFGMLIAPSVEVLDQFPVTAVLAVLAATVVAYLAAYSRFRVYFAVGGLTVVAVGMLILFVLFNADDPLRPGDTFDMVFTPILVVVGVIAACCAFAGTGSAMAEESAAPAVLAGAVTPFSLGSIAIVSHFTLHKPAGKAPIVGLLPPVVVSVLLATTLLVVLVRATRTQM